MAIEIPNYTLLSLLGQGAMAEVWLAEHRIHKRKAAIKILRPTSLVDDDVDALFQREGEVLAEFRDENIVAIYDISKIGGLAFIVMEYLPGGTLLDMLNRETIHVGQAIALIVQIARALGVAHSKKIIHRDLKPANVILRDETTPVLTDFGAVRVLDRATIYGRNGGTVGTPTYMSPEQIANEPLDGRSDLYALGVLFFQLLTGDPPFRDPDPHEVVSMHLNKVPPPLVGARLQSLQPIMDRLLAKSPRDRFASAETFIDALRDVFRNDLVLRRTVEGSSLNSDWRTRLNALGFELSLRSKSERLPPSPANTVVVNGQSSEPPPERWVAPKRVQPEPKEQTRSPAGRNALILSATLLAVCVAGFIYSQRSRPSDERGFSQPTKGVVSEAPLADQEVGKDDKGRQGSTLTAPNNLDSNIRPSTADVQSRFQLARVDGRGVVRDHATALSWTISDNGMDITWADALSYCTSIGGRLPRVAELMAIYDRKMSGKCGDSACGASPLFQLTGAKFWSSEPNRALDAWHVTLYYGFRASHPVNRADGMRALCVLGNNG